jgi:beta-glucosidase/6-phospho-beta-glucosidase/beta-galactosidase
VRAFPDGFLWGVSTSAYQVEGAVGADGRGPSIWDTFSHTPGKIANGDTGDVACDHYRRWRDDLDLIASLGVNAYRFSLAWPRIFPDGDGRLEHRGLDHFDRLIDRLLELGITPVVTLYHWDLPQPLQELRASGREGRIGAALSLAPHYPATDTDADRAAAWASDGYVNRWFLDPVLKGSYPQDLQSLYEGLAGPLDFVQDGDLGAIATPSDYLGVNYYSRRVVRAAPNREPFPWDVVVAGDVPLTEGGTDGVPRTEAGTEITPEAFTDLLVRLRDDYGDIPLLITENGGVFGDTPAPDGRVHDDRRSRFIHDHLAAVHAAIEQGVPVVGYCHWSFMDNFEWALGYAQRFGLVHVDYETLARTVKDSGRYYAEIARANALRPLPT